MKKTLVLFLLLLTCCVPAPIANPTATRMPITNPTATLVSTPEPTATPIPAANLTATQTSQPEYHPSVEAFKASEQCPNVCWLGIHPGKTTVEQAVQLLKNSKDITLIESSDNNINAGWFTSNVKENPLGVDIEVSSGVVKSINFILMYPFTVNDFVNLLGEPDQLKIEVIDHWEGGRRIDYTLYYVTLNTILHMRFGSKDGPSPDDYVYEMTVNISPVKDKYFQPWLGYGHLQDYLPKAVPTPTPYNP